MTTRRLGAMTAAVLAAGLALSLASAASSGPAARAAIPNAFFGRAFALSPPGNSSKLVFADAFGLSCSSFGNCVVGGAYTDKSGNFEPMAVTENSGKWSRGVELKLPNDAPASVAARVFSVSCPRIGDCTAVGDYPKQNADGGRIFAITESGGQWQQATELKLPSDAASPPRAQVFAVRCWAVGWCMATGNYSDSANHWHAAVFTESNGSWHRGTEIDPPSDAGPTPNLELYGLACQKGGQCVLAGEYLDAAAHWIGYGLIVSHGSYLSAGNINLPPNADGSWVEFTSVSCQSLIKCVIVGAYNDKSGQAQPLSAVESNYAFKSAVQVPTLPGELRATLYAVSCTTGGPCVAVGSYADTAFRNHAFEVTRSATGHWGYGVIVVNPPDASPGIMQADLLIDVSCFAKGCVAAGFYRTKVNGDKAMAAIEP